MAFGRFERLVAWRYLRPTKGEGFISVIAGFALSGIALGVGTLIVVLAVMNGFRAELLGRVLGVNGHATVVSGPAGIPNFDGLVAGLEGAPGLVGVMPYVEGQVMASANGVASGALVRGVRPADLAAREVVRQPHPRRVAGGPGHAGHRGHRHAAWRSAWGSASAARSP